MNTNYGLPRSPSADNLHVLKTVEKEKNFIKQLEENQNIGDYHILKPRRFSVETWMHPNEPFQLKTSDYEFFEKFKFNENENEKLNNNKTDDESFIEEEFEEEEEYSYYWVSKEESEENISEKIKKSLVEKLQIKLMKPSSDVSNELNFPKKINQESDFEEGEELRKVLLETVENLQNEVEKDKKNIEQLQQQINENREIFIPIKKTEKAGMNKDLDLINQNFESEEKKVDRIIRRNAKKARMNLSMFKIVGLMSLLHIGRALLVGSNPMLAVGITIFTLNASLWSIHNFVLSYLSKTTFGLIQFLD